MIAEFAAIRTLMSYRTMICLLLLVSLWSCTQTKTFNAEDGWQHFVQTVEERYAYLDTAPVDWYALKTYYAGQIQFVKSESELVDLLQTVKQYFIDPHFN